MNIYNIIKRTPNMLINVFKIRTHIYDILGSLEVKIAKTDEPVPFADKEKLQYNKIKKGYSWGKKFSSAWFNFTGKIPKYAAGREIALLIDLGGEGLYVSENNEAIASITDVSCFPFFFGSTRGKQVIDYLNPCQGEGKIDIWIEGGFNQETGQAIFKRAVIAAVRNNVKEYYFDYLTLLYAMQTLKKGSPLYNHYKFTIKNSYSLLKDYSDNSVEKANLLLKGLLNKSSEVNFSLYSVGHSHLDLVYLWPMREAKRKAARTIINAINCIKKYPEYIYGLSQPQQIEWMEEEYPDIFIKIKDAVAKGNIELQGGMWCEADTNLISGESLIRQILVGKQYINKHFNKDMRMCWIPDVFGYSAALPQILKKTGIDYFVTTKLSWNEHNKFPYSTFNWEGLDDSNVLVHLPPEDTYNSNGNPIDNNYAYKNFKEKDILNSALMLFGIGDGGGGAGEGHLELLIRQKNLEEQPKVVFSTAIDYLEKINPLKNKFNNYKGELYLEKHQGTYTSQANNKKYNRKIEYLLRDVEFLGVIAEEKGYVYPKNKLLKIWKEVLLYQFHDCIPGSSIKRVYDECIPRYKIMLGELEGIKKEMLSYISDMKAYSLINTLGFRRSEYIKKDNIWYKAEAEAFSSAKLTKLEQNAELGLLFGDFSLENQFLRLTFDDNGNIIRLFDKVNNEESADKYLNRLSVYKDKKMFFNAWDIDINYTKQTPSNFKLLKTLSYIDGAKVVRKNTYRYNKSVLEQEVTLFADKPYVLFDTWVDWHEKHKMLRADFITKRFSDKVLCDIQFGNLKRTTKTDDKLSWAQFEICAHKYVDVTDKGEYGYSVMSDSKYGYRVKDGLISLNLLRSPVYPDETCDMGEHNFSYIFMPHKGDAFAANVPAFAYAFNISMVECEEDITLDKIISVDARNIIVETVKLAENGNGFIIRLYENEGKNTDMEMQTSLNYSKIYETDMLENIISDSTLKLSFKPYEVKTLFFAK